MGRAVRAARRPATAPLLLLATLAGGCAHDRAARSSGPSPDARPNLVVVLVDDMRWDEYGAAGHAYLETPNIDRLAAEGARFTNAFATTPLCSPSRASFLTGLYAHAHGITDNRARNARSHELPTFARLLDAAGYDTAFIGKWHMGNDDSPRPGFDEWVALRGQGEAVDPRLNVNGHRRQATGYVTDVLSDHALAFMARERRRPFLLYLAHKALHPNVVQRDDGSTADIGPGGYVAAPRHRGRYAQALFTRRPNAYVPPHDKPALMRPIGNLPPLGRETATSEGVIRERAEMLLAVDDSLGRLLAALEARGHLDDTVVVFTSDHGFWYGEHGLGEERRLAYEEGIRIPLLVRYPRAIAPGARLDALVLNVDLAPTLVDLAGVAPDAALHGRSLLPLLRGQRPAWRSSFLVEYYSDTVFERIFRMGYKAVRTERHKYIRYEELDGMDELYDLRADPHELRNLAADQEARPLLDEMQRELARLLAASGATETPGS